MQQLLNVWSRLDMRRRVIVVAATAGMFLTVFFLSKVATAPGMALLYAGLENQAAADVVRALEQRGAMFEVRGDSVYVDSSQRDELRLVLAGEGLPVTGGRGYELLDTLNGFGTTSQMFDAAYWRAKEGELARTIVNSPFVSQARVHIANNGSNPFQRNVSPSASVYVVPSGAPVSPVQANALRYLVASAVAGMHVDDVAIIDANGTLIGVADEPTGTGSGDDRSLILRERVLRLVEARVGAGNAVVEVSVDTVTETESIKEKRFDPESRVAISTETEERSDASQNQAGGAVTVASNLPDGDAAEGEGSSAQTSETRERVNYEVSETQREIVRAPGEVKRLTVAVLVNGLPATNANGTTQFRPRPPEELDALRDLVASAVGYREERGDVITLKSMELPTVAPMGTVADSSIWNRVHLDVMTLIQLAVLSIVAFVLGLFVLRPILTKPAAISAGGLPALADHADTLSPATAREPALTGEIDDGDFSPVAATGIANGNVDSGELPALPDDADDPVARLRSMIGERQEETVEILRTWLEQSEETT